MEATTTSMKLSRAAVLATSAAMAVAAAEVTSSSSSSLLPVPPTQWYPNWAGGTNICLPDASSLPVGATSYYYSFATSADPNIDFLLDEEPPAYMTQQNLMMESRDECCDSYYWWDMADCVEGSPDLIIGDDDDDDDGDGDGGGSVASGHEEIVYAEGGVGGVGEAENNSIGSDSSVADGESGEAAALDDNAIDGDDDAEEGEDVDGAPSALANDAGEVEQQQQTQQTQPKQNQPKQQQEPLPQPQPQQQLPPYGGSLEWYADYSHFKCVQDCPQSSDDAAATGISLTDFATEIISAGGTDDNDAEAPRCGGLLAAPTATISTTMVAAAAAKPYSNNATTSSSTTNSITNSNSNNSRESLLLFPTTEACCKSRFAYLASAACVASSTGGTYAGSGHYYADYANGRCVQDCVTNREDDDSSPHEGICGGIVMEAATELHADSAACCSAHFSSDIDPLLCETRSAKGSVEEGTFRLYPDAVSGTCLIDHDPSNAMICSIGYTCRLIPSASYIAKLYHVSPAGVSECCSEGLSLEKHVNPSYCKARTMGVVSRKWFVNYAERLCHQDCKDEADPSCAVNTDSATTYYDTNEECCASKLGYVNRARCLANSAHVPYEGSNDYFVNYRDSKCVRDCPASHGGNCGGVVQDSSTSLHGNVTACCESKLSYVDLGLCEDRSDGLAAGTGRYYPSEEDAICVKDTSITPCPAGETCQRVDGWLATLYDSTAECCQSNNTLPSVNTEFCQSYSTGVATEKWFRHDGNRCAKHCADATSSSAECDIPVDPSSPFYATSLECCTTELDYLNIDTCMELSAKGGILSDLVGTDEYYVDWIHQACVKNCPEGSHSNDDESVCGGIAGASWIILYPDVEDCCAALYYIDREDCLDMNW